MAGGGYDLQFVEPPPESLRCPICYLILRDPHLTVCCGRHYCQICTQKIREYNGERRCPFCNEDLNTRVTVLNLATKREVDRLRVYCPHKAEGCDWVGDLGDMPGHLNREGEGTERLKGCGYVELTCAYECGGRFQRSVIRQHEYEDCPSRPVDVVLHWAIEKITTLLAEDQTRKGEFERHKKEIQVENDELKARILELERQQVGNQAEIKMLKSTDIHEIRSDTNSLQAQVSDMAEKQVQSAEASDRKLQEFEDFQNKQKAEISHEVVHFKQSTVNKLEEISERLQTTQQASQANIGERMKYFAITPTPPFYFALSNFELHKKNDLVWVGPPFYSGPMGYKMRFIVHPYGVEAGKGSHVSVFAAILKGEYDADLKWPFRGTVKLEVYDWTKEEWSYGTVVAFTEGDSAEYTARPINRLGNRAIGYRKLISHGDVLKFKIDSLRFRVVNVVVVAE